MLVVAGGISERCKSNEFCNDNGWTSSTEMYKIGDPLWRLVAKLDNWIQGLIITISIFNFPPFISFSVILMLMLMHNLNFSRNQML